MKSKVKISIAALEYYIAGMNYAVGKAKRGSEFEDMYFLEKLEKMANHLGYDLIKQRGAK